MNTSLIKVGQIGCHGVAHNHAKAHQWTGNTQLVAVCDIDENRVREFAEQYAIQRWYTSAQEMLEASDLDMIDLVTPDHTHAPFAIAAMKQGKHVLVEKPMTINLDDAQTMIDASLDNQVQLMCVQSQRWLPKIQNIVQRVHAGDIGMPVYVRYWGGCPTFWNPDHWPGIPKNQQAEFLLVHNAMHSMDLLCWLFDDVPQSVYTLGHPGQEGVPLWEYFSVNLRLSRGGMGLFEENRIMQPANYPLPGNALHIIGTEGTITLPSTRDLSVSLYNRDGTQYPGSHMYMLPEEDNFAAMIRAMADAIQHNKPVPVHPTYSRSVLAGVLAAAESFRTGKPVEVNHA